MVVPMTVILLAPSLSRGARRGERSRSKIPTRSERESPAGGQSKIPALPERIRLANPGNFWDCSKLMSLCFRIIPARFATSELKLRPCRGWIGARGGKEGPRQSADRASPREMRR